MEPATILENECLQVEISSLGAELQSVKKAGAEYLWNGNALFWERRAPILFPAVGRLKDRQYVHEGKQFPMGQHGFARDMYFEKLEASRTAAVYRLSYNAETLACYPFRFCLDTSYVLEDSRIGITWRVSHEDDFPMYFSLGYHPAFRCPLLPGTLQEEYSIDFHTKEPVVYQRINKENLVEPEIYLLETKDGVARITPHIFDEDVLIVHAEHITSVSLLRPNRTPYVRVSVQSPLLGLWSPMKKHAPFLCVEPWYGCNDAVDFAGELKDRPWIQKLEPGHQFVMNCTLNFL